MGFLFWWLVMVWQPAMMCAGTGGAYQPAESQAVALCRAMLDARASETAPQRTSEGNAF
jgi:hypothetical protein